ncbi:hypothetical protein BpHYR1_037660 [Brachionus plicatilis]|nr:hypothetical protein BpHYR1_037660 [Brachionus plicatilis]
MKEYLR